MNTRRRDGEPTVWDLPLRYKITMLWCAGGITVAVALLIAERAGL